MMPIYKSLAAALVLGAFALGGCATTEQATADSGASAGHNHMRDNKQGSAPRVQRAEAPPAKPLHDHREMK